MGVSSKYPDSLKGFQEITDGRKKQLARIASIRKRPSILTIADQIDNLSGNEVNVRINKTLEITAYNNNKGEQG